jgi:two-component system, OmpR family, response regulator QseB
MELLLIGDSEVLGNGAQIMLQGHGVRVTWARNKLTALESIQMSQYDVIMLDLNISWHSGLELLSRIRQDGIRIPIMVLSAASKIIDRVIALDAGADDYLVKPFDLEELSARLRALYRRCSCWEQPPLNHGDLQLDPYTRIVTIQNDEVPLSVREFDILHALLESKGRVISREALGEKIYTIDDDIASNALDVHIHNLRKKLGTNPIRTVRGVGYLIEKSK